MQQTRKKINSKKPQDPNQQEEHAMEQISQRTNKVHTKVIEPIQQIVTDLTGKFPVTSNMIEYKVHCTLWYRD